MALANSFVGLRNCSQQSGISGYLSWRQRENQPSLTSIHGWKSEDLPQEDAICCRILLYRSGSGLHVGKARSREKSAKFITLSRVVS